MGVLDIVDRVLTVLADGEVEVEFHRGFRTGVEEVACGVHRNLIQQICQRDGFTGALGHPLGLPVAHELDQLHEDDVQAVLAVEVQRVHCTLETGNVSVVIGAPDVDGLVEAANLQLVAVIGDVRGKIGVKPVGAAQHVVLQIQLGDGFLALAFGEQLAAEDFGGAQPEGAVLLIGKAHLGQTVDRGLDETALVKLGFQEPAVVLHAVAAEVFLHLRDVALKAEFRHGGMTLRFRLGEPLVAFLGMERLCQFFDILAVVTVGRETVIILHIRQPIFFLFRQIRQVDLPLGELLIPRVDGSSELLDLVAGVVYIELAADLIAGEAQHGCKCIAQHTAAGVAKVHGAGGIGRDELDIDPLSFPVIDVAVGHALFTDAAKHLTVPAPGQAEVDKTGTGNGDRGEKAPVQCAVRGERFCDLARRKMQRAGADHGMVCGVVPVGDILRNLHCSGELGSGRKRLCGHCRLICLPQKLIRVLFCQFYQISHYPSPSP